MGKPKGKQQRVKLGVMTCTGRKRLGWNGGKTGRASPVRIIMKDGILVQKTLEQKVDKASTASMASNDR
jgi:hypothetical protein